MIERLRKFKETSDFHGIAEVFWTVVPAFTAAGFAWESTDSKILYCIHVRRPFDETLAVRIITHVKKHAPTSIPNKLIKLDGLKPTRTNQMDTVMLAGPSYIHRFEYDDPELSKHTIVPFPAFDSEFSCAEDPALFDDLIHGRSDIGDWNRRKRPQVWDYVDATVAVAKLSPTRTWTLTDTDMILTAIKNIKSRGKVLVRNFHLETIILKRTADTVTLTIEGSNKSSTHRLADLPAVLDTFVNHGLTKINPA